jgi:hypothetical protein
MTARNTLLFTALAAALISTSMFAASPAFAQEVPPPDTTETEAGVPKDRLVSEYSATLFAGDDVAAADAVTALRTGGDFSVVTTTTQQAKNADGTLATNPDGTPKMETVIIETAVANENGPMGWGEVDHSLGIAQALVDSGQAASLDEALLGTATTTTVTNADGTTTTTTTYSGGILAMRADGMGWGQIAKELGFKLGSVVGNGKGGADVAASAKGERASDGERAAKSERAAKAERAAKGERAAKSERVAKAERVAKVERVARIERPDRPDRVERPAKPERPERPQKPERSGRP